MYYTPARFTFRGLCSSMLWAERTTSEFISPILKECWWLKVKKKEDKKGNQLKSQQINSSGEQVWLFHFLSFKMQIPQLPSPKWEDHFLLFVILKDPSLHKTEQWFRGWDWNRSCSANIVLPDTSQKVLSQANQMLACKQLFGCSFCLAWR